MEQSQDNESFSETVNYIDQANNSRVLSCSSQLQNAPASNILSPVRKVNDQFYIRYQCKTQNIWMSEEGLPQHIIIDISQIKERPKFFKFVSFDCWHDYKSNPSIIEFLVSTDDKKEFITWSTFYLELKEGTQVFSIDSLGRRYNFIKILVKETFGASKTYLNSFKLFEEKPFPNKIEQQQFMSIDMKRDNSLLHDQAQMEDHDTSGTYFQGVRSQATNYSLAINSNVPNTINTMQTQANQTLPDLLIGFTSVNSQNNTPQVKNNNNMSSNNSERRIKHNSINKIKQISPTQEKPNYFPLPRVGHLQNSHSSKSKSNMANNSYSDVRQFNLPTPTENQKNKHSSSFHAYQQSGFQVKQNHFNGSGDEYSIQSEQEANKRLFSAERQQQSSQQQYLNSHESKHENEILNQGQHQKQVVSHMYQEKQDNQFIKQRGINQSISIPTQQVEPFFLPNTPSAVIIQQHNSINQGFVPQQQQQQQHMSYQISSNSKVQNEVSYQTQNIRNQNQIGFEGPEQFNNLFQNHQFMQNHTRMSQPQDRGNNNPPLILTQSEREIMNMKIIVGELKQEIIQKDQRISNQDERIEQLERAIHSLLQRTSALEATLDLMDTSTVIQQQFNKNQEQNKEEDVFHTSQKQQLPLNSPQTFGKYQQNNYGIKQISADYSPDHSNVI